MNQKFFKHILADNGNKLSTTLTNNRDVVTAKTNFQFHKFRGANFKGLGTRPHDSNLPKKFQQSFGQINFLKIPSVIKLSLNQNSFKFSKNFGNVFPVL